MELELGSVDVQGGHEAGGRPGGGDEGVLGQPDYMLMLDCWTMKIQD